MALTDGIISYWKLDINNCTQVDSVDNNYEGDLFGATYTTSGKINAAWDFDGTNDRMDTEMIAENINDPDDGDFTFACWFKTDVDDVRQIIADTGGSGGGQLGCGFEINSTNDLRVILRTANKRFDLDGSSTIATGSWYYLVASWDQSTETVTAYLNNSEEINSSTSTNVSNSGTRNLELATNATTNTIFFNGVLDEVAVWDRVLTSSERTSLYNDGDGNQYPFTEDEGTNMKINIGDTWKPVAGMKINIGDSWKTVLSVKQNIGDEWKTVF